MATSGGRGSTTEFRCPDIYHFPPFFTLQPVDATKARQLDQWRQLIISWHQFYKQQSVAVREWPLWENAAISRRLPDEGIFAVLEYCVSTGSAEWEDAAHTRARIYYRTPIEWGRALHSFAVEHGLALPASIYTVYEIRTSGDWEGNEFCALDAAVLVRALEALEREGLAVLHREAGVTPLDEIGVTLKERKQ